QEPYSISIQGMELSVFLLIIYLVIVKSGEVADDRGNIHNTTPRPCCFPYKFQAVVTQLTSFSVQNKVVTRLYRDWDSKIQVQEQATFTVNNIQSTGFKTIMDYKHGKLYTVNGDECRQAPLNSGMLEPCMPDNAVYLGTSYVGQESNSANFDTWYFKRNDFNRNLEMTVSVASDSCVPIMEHIVGTIGEGATNNLVFFTNVTSVTDVSVFNLPYTCLSNVQM
ncbi:ependymin-related protein 1 isoform X1, partial [Biomphalaria glabrata]